MPEINLSNLLIASLFLLPGYIFLSTAARNAIPGGIAFRGTFIQLIGALICSLIVFMAFDHSGVRSRLCEFIADKPLLRLHLKKVSENLNDEPILHSTLKFLLRPTSKANAALIADSKETTTIDDAEFVQYLIYSILFLLTPFAWLFASFVTLIHAVIWYFIRLNIGRPFIWTYYVSLWFADNFFPAWASLKSIMKVKNKFKQNIFDLLLKLPLPFAKIILRSLLILKRLMIEMIGVTIVALFNVVLVLTLPVAAVVVIIILFFELAAYMYFMAFRLFSPPSGDIFRSFSKRISIPIIEIKCEDGIILKGRLLDYMPDSQGQISNISISHVMQYSKDKDESLFLAGKRKAYIFPHFSSQLVIPYSKVKDFNIWYLPSDEFGAYFSIKTDDQLERQAWYLKLYLHYNKASFNFAKDWKFSVSTELAPKFCMRLIDVLEENYIPKLEDPTPFIFRRKIKNLLGSFTPVFFNYLREHRRIFPLDNEIRREAVARLRKVRTACFRQA